MPQMFFLMHFNAEVKSVVHSPKKIALEHRPRLEEFDWRRWKVE